MEQQITNVGEYPLTYDYGVLSEFMLVELLDRDIRFELSDDVRQMLEESQEYYDDDEE